MMSRDSIVSYLRTMGLRVDAQGVITDDNQDFGVLMKEKMRPVAGAPVSLADVEGIFMGDGKDYLVVVLTDDRRYIFEGGSIDRIRLMSEIEAEDVEDRIRKGMGAIPEFFQQIGGGALAPKTTSALNAVFPHMFPEWRDQLFYDELSETQMIDMSMFGYDHLGVRSLDDTAIAIYHEHVEIRLKALGFNTIQRLPPNSVRDEVLLIRVMSNSRNPFRDWVESHEWDGKPRVDSWFRNLFGATSVVLEESDDLRYLAAVSRSWFLGGIERMYHPVQLDVVPIFVGGQGAGKTRALKFTAGKDEWYRSTGIDMSSKDTSRFLDSVRGGVIVELGEATQFQTTSADAMKQFISQDTDHLRKAYAKKEQSFPRHFIMAATSNRAEIFTDPTGNRRFFPMMCNPTLQTQIFSVQDRSVGNHDVEQLWAEALSRYMAGERSSMTREEIRLSEIVQGFFTKETPQVGRIDEWLDDPANGYDRVGSRITRADLMEGVFGYIAGISPEDSRIERAVNQWSASEGKWRRCKPFRRKTDPNHRVCRGWERISEPGSKPVPRATFAMVSSHRNSDEIEWAKLVVKFRKLMADNLLSEGSICPMDFLNLPEFEQYRDRGFIDSMTVNGEVLWVVKHIP